ncbi:sel1 repeat family protein [Helicobacter suis]|uniref:sel1 repeat family protein n=1 Tax=Helicobacter suis TaxID=104628 RepID=UPI0013D691C0|nr:sel1 repeat family protein [Helicobacter suis]
MGFFKFNFWLFGVCACFLLAEGGVSTLIERGLRLESKGSDYEAYRLYSQAQKNGDLLGTAFVGKMYLGGWGVKKDACRAVTYFEFVINRARSDNNLAAIVAKVGLASAYAEGKCVFVNRDIALKLIQEVLFVNGGGNYKTGWHLARLEARKFTKEHVRKHYIGAALYMLGNGANPTAGSAIDVEILKKAVEFGNQYALEQLQNANQPPKPKEFINY